MKQTVLTISELDKCRFDDKLQEYINALIKRNCTYTVQFSTCFDVSYNKIRFSAMIIFEGDCCL